ncbi:DUF4118 domain-containing protein [Haloferula sargassicola]|uniref:histidine kinase n=1 Tax=Haloferula sargassicola TaxID=490096 RepID=A0ABP9UPJ1_9BACT
MTDASPHGRLKVFLGMCPGVGKTYAMLLAARALAEQGTDLVVGVVETHGRKETAALLEGLERQPMAKLPHRGTVLEEMDLDGLLARRPPVVLVDELAHSNAPGSRHPKRWQDVVELLEAGIDVLTTLNIQHLESRADIVRGICGVPVRETVPDSLLDRADSIELIDLSPRDLLRRLEEGKVYLGDRAQAAAANFFRPSHLTALRQLALRYTSERVGVDLHDIRSQRRHAPSWRVRERLLVAVGPSPFSPALIRRARAMAGALDAPWSAIAINTDETLSPDDAQRVSRHLALARELGAEASILEATDLVAGLLAAAREQGATQIVIGKSPRHRWRDHFRPPPALALLQSSGDIDVVAIEPGVLDETPAPPSTSSPPPAGRSATLREIAVAAIVAGVLAALGLLVFPWLGADNLALLLLCGVILGGLRFALPGTLTLALLSGLLWNFLFTEPFHSFEIHDPRDAIMFVALTIAALSIGSVASRLRRRERALSRQQSHHARLLEITGALTGPQSDPRTLGHCLETIMTLFRRPCALRLRDDATHELGPPHPAGRLELDPRDQAVAEWVFEKRQAAGHGTANLPEAAALHLPLQGRSFAMGVLSISPENGGLTFSDREILAAIAAQLGLALERDHLLRAIHHAEFLERSEQLRRSLLDHVSHELRTPVAIIGAALDALENEVPGRDLAPEMRAAHRRLRRVVDQLVESARLETGQVQPQPEWWDLLDLCETARERSQDDLTGHPFAIHIASGTPALVWLDGELTLAVLVNLLANAGQHTPAGTAIDLDAGLAEPDRLRFRVRDQGPGLADPARVFDRFHRGPHARPGGLGLGLSIVAGIVRGLGGTVTAGNATPQGAEFVIELPVRTSDHPPA